MALLHNYLLHASGVNNTDISRRAFIVCYMDAPHGGRQWREVHRHLWATRSSSERLGSGGDLARISHHLAA